MNKKHKKNLETYYKYLPIIGIITSILVFIMFYFIFKQQENITIIIIYSLLPFLIYSLISIIHRLFSK